MTIIKSSGEVYNIKLFWFAKGGVIEKYQENPCTRHQGYYQKEPVKRDCEEISLWISWNINPMLNNVPLRGHVGMQEAGKYCIQLDNNKPTICSMFDKLTWLMGL